MSIDGMDGREGPPAFLRRNIALVSQELTLFDDSIRANIAYGRPEADLADIEAAARHAAAHDFIMALPEGYDTLVGENGVKLSGGQRQRIAIARRSEEHTSEIQSLMRISYAVFCLKKKH